MNRYIIRGKIQKSSKNIEGGIQALERDTSKKQELRNLRVEAWDKDRNYDDPLGEAFTDTRGVFELSFEDEDFQQEPDETEPTPDLYFKVFRDEELLEETPVKIDFPLTLGREEGTPLDLNLSEEGSIYQLVLNDLFVIETPDQSDRPLSTETPDEKIVQIVDVLPSLDQIQHSGRIVSTSAPTSSSSDLQGIVDSALGNILGNSQRSTDPKVLLSTLNQTFTARQVDGRTVYELNPQSVTIRASDLGGGITGAQASLYHRAKTAIQDGLQLLNNLYPLNAGADKENMEATRSIVRTEMQELLAELGARGGPRILRVDNLFQLLLGENDNGYQRLGGQLKKLAEYFGLLPSQINTVEEEQNFSNFLTLKDYLQSLQRSWIDYKRSQDSSAGAFIGTQLVRLSQALAVVGESVQEVYRIMDLFFLGPEERLSVYIDFTKARENPERQGQNRRLDPNSPAFPLPDGTAYTVGDTAQLRDSMSVEGLLNWILRFATEEGPLLAKSGGKLGIQVIAETSDRLMVLTQAATYAPIPNAAFRREGVIRALRDLAFQLYQVHQLAEQVKPPTGSKPDDLESAPRAGGTSA